MSFTQMLFAADFCPPFDPGLKFSKKSKTSRPAEIHPVFIWAYEYGSDIENSWQNQKKIAKNLTLISQTKFCLNFSLVLFGDRRSAISPNKAALILRYLANY